MAIKTITEQENISKIRKKQKDIVDAINVDKGVLELLKSENISLQKSIDGLNKEIKDLTSKRDEIEGGNKVLFIEKDGLNSELSDKKDKLKEIGGLVEKTRKETEEKVRKIKIESNKEIKETVKEVVDNNKELDGLKLGIKVSTGEVERLAKEKVGIREDIKEKKMTLDWLVNEIDLREKEKKNLLETLTELKKTEKSSADTLDILSTQNTTTREDSSVAKTMLKELSNQIEAMKEALEEKTKEVESKKNTMIGLIEREQKVNRLSKRLVELYKKAGINITI